MQQSRVCHEKPELSRELQDHPRTASPAEYLGNREDLRIEEKILGLHDIVEYYLHIVVKGLKKKKKKKREGRGERRKRKTRNKYSIVFRVVSGLARQQLCSTLHYRVSCLCNSQNLTSCLFWL